VLVTEDDRLKYGKQRDWQAYGIDGGMFVDGLPTSTVPYYQSCWYGHPSPELGTPGNTYTGTPAVLKDEPAFWDSDTEEKDTFIDVAVAVTGPDIGTAYDAVEWSFWKSADTGGFLGIGSVSGSGKIYSSGKLTEVPTWTPYIQAAIDAWNGRGGFFTPISITTWR
jgi:hypothetical protein